MAQVAEVAVCSQINAKHISTMWVDVGTAVYLREGNISRVMAADRPYGEFNDFYSASPEYFGYTLVYILKLSPQHLFESSVTIYHSVRSTRINLLAPEFFSVFLAHPVCKM
jgi:hypothetical protein